jgi:regulator of cell morphogenesis and NO signaling
MTIAATSTVGEVASAVPQATRVFEKYRIDYCCGGRKSISDACSAAGISFHELISAIDQEAARDTASSGDYSNLSQRDLIDHIVSTHHSFTREEVMRLEALLRKVVAVYGQRHPELVSVQATFAQLVDDLMPHLMKEETVLFPYVAQVEVAAKDVLPLASPPFITVQNPVRMMMLEHEAAGELLRNLRAITSDYRLPEDACSSFRTLYAALEDFEKDLHQHIHLESNILFPRAIATEAELLRNRVPGEAHEIEMHRPAYFGTQGHPEVC